MKYTIKTVCLLVLLISFVFASQAGALTIEQILESAYDSTTGTLQMSLASGSAKDVTALTNTVSYPFDFTHETSGSPANGIGVGIKFIQETSASNNETGMYLEAVTTDVTAASEDFEFNVGLMKAGATASEVMSISSVGVLSLVNAATLDNSTNGTLTITEPAIVLASDSVTVNGFFDSPYLLVEAASYTVAAASKANHVIVAYTDTGAAGITLATVLAVDGRLVTIKDGDLNAGSNNITIGTEGAETIDEAATYAMDANGESVTLLSDGTNWFVMSAYGE